MQAVMSVIREGDYAAPVCHKDDMASELYNLLMSIKPEGLTENAWLRRADVNRNFFQSVKSGARPRTDTLEKVVAAIGFTPAQFYELEGGKNVKLADETAPKIGLPLQRRDEPRDLPLMGTAQGSDFEVMDDGKIVFVERFDLNQEAAIDYVRRPSTLVGKEVYAITVVGDSMADRYKDGDPAYVDSKRQPRAGDYVVVQLRKEDAGEDRLTVALLKQLVRSTSQEVVLRQTNPVAEFAIPRKDIAAVHRVIPWSEIVFF